MSIVSRVTINPGDGARMLGRGWIISPAEACEHELKGAINYVDGRTRPGRLQDVESRNQCNKPASDRRGLGPTDFPRGGTHQPPGVRPLGQRCDGRAAVLALRGH